MSIWVTTFKVRLCLSRMLEFLLKRSSLFAFVFRRFKRKVHLSIHFFFHIRRLPNTPLYEPCLQQFGLLCWTFKTCKQFLVTFDGSKRNTCSLLLATIFPALSEKAHWDNDDSNEHRTSETKKDYKPCLPRALFAVTCRWTLEELVWFFWWSSFRDLRVTWLRGPFSRC